MESQRWAIAGGSLIGVVSMIVALGTPPLQAQVVRQLTYVATGTSGTPALDDAGTLVYANMTTDQFGTNPGFAWQIASWNAMTGNGTPVTSFGDGVSWTSPSISLSDDGQWIAFISPADASGLNHDESLELFVMKADGTNLTQLTNDAAPNAGAVLRLAMAGSGNRVLFVADTDPLGSNPNHLNQLFVVERDGTALRQLTAATVNLEHEEFGLGISDDGERVVFSHRGNLTGGNADGNLEIYAIQADGTGLRQLTASVLGGDVGRPGISGNGERVCFDSTSAMAPGNHVYTINWDGTGQARVSAVGTDAFFPSITDDGQFVVYSAAPQSLEDNFEIWRAGPNGNQRTQLTATEPPMVNSRPVVSGGGNRIAFEASGGAYPGGSNPDGGAELIVMDFNGGGILQLTENHGAGASIAATITPDGSRVVFSSFDVYRIEANGSGLFQLTNLAEWPAETPSVSADGDTIVFHSYDDPLGQNPALHEAVFAVDADGTGLRQLSPAGADAYSVHPVIAADGSWVIFQSDGDFAGGNPDRSPELFRVRPDGSELFQITSDDGGSYKWPRVDDAGEWVAFQSDSDFDGLNPDGSIEVLRVRSDGTGLERITANTQPGGHSDMPDISGSGDRIVYRSNTDPLGSNADGNYEIFLYEPATMTTQQLTSTIDGDSYEPRISRDGSVVYFRCDAPIFEDQPLEPYDAYRVTVATGVVERAGALRRGTSGLEAPAGYRYRHYQVAPDATGARAAFADEGNWIDANPDFDYEVYLIDQSEPPSIEVGKVTPTIVSWKSEPRWLRYDVIRGDVDNLGHGQDSTVDLGPVVCLEDESPDASTEGAEDAAAPASGQVFFYLYRGSQGLADDTGSFGTGTGARERVAGAGDCPL